jgi:aryl-alcohol dehydrogenase-like predicted oxidoreductase
MLTERIILGTANFAKPYNGTQVKDVDAILEYAKEVGIWAIETATDYETHHLEYPRKIVKVQKDDFIGDDESVECIMAHQPDAYERTMSLIKNQKHPVRSGVSIYDVKDIEYLNGYSVKPDTIELPYSVLDRRADKYIDYLAMNGVIIIARSVFLRGKVLEYIDTFHALSFVLMRPYIFKAVIGTESLQMLQDTLEPLIELDKLGIEDEEIIDCRRWKND